MKKAVIFDMDGVISDTQKYHAEVESKLLKKFNIFLSPETITRKYAGVSDEKMFREIFEENNIIVPNIDKLIAEKWKLMKEISKGNLQAIPYAVKLINNLKENKFKLAVASASTIDFITYVLDSLGVRSKFDVVVSSQEVKNGKPAPDIFILAASRLNVKPTEAVVVEDGVSGMIGAKAANIKVIGLVANKTSPCPADVVVTRLNQVSLEVIRKI